MGFQGFLLSAWLLFFHRTSNLSPPGIYNERLGMAPSFSTSPAFQLAFLAIHLYFHSYCTGGTSLFIHFTLLFYLVISTLVTHSPLTPF